LNSILKMKTFFWNKIIAFMEFLQSKMNAFMISVFSMILDSFQVGNSSKCLWQNSFSIQVSRSLGKFGKKFFREGSLWCSWSLFIPFHLQSIKSFFITASDTSEFALLCEK
jgi:hypothetical protein